MHVWFFQHYKCSLHSYVRIEMQNMLAVTNLSYLHQLEICLSAYSCGTWQVSYYNYANASLFFFYPDLSTVVQLYPFGGRNWFKNWKINWLYQFFLYKCLYFFLVKWSLGANMLLPIIFLIVPFGAVGRKKVRWAIWLVMTALCLIFQVGIAKEEKKYP